MFFRSDDLIFWFSNEKIITGEFIGSLYGGSVLEEIKYSIYSHSKILFDFFVSEIVYFFLFRYSCAKVDRIRERKTRGKSWWLTDARRLKPRLLCGVSRGTKEKIRAGATLETTTTTTRFSSRPAGAQRRASHAVIHAPSLDRFYFYCRSTFSMVFSCRINYLISKRCCDLVNFKGIKPRREKIRKKNDKNCEIWKTRFLHFDSICGSCVSFQFPKIWKNLSSTLLIYFGIN